MVLLYGWPVGINVFAQFTQKNLIIDAARPVTNSFYQGYAVRKWNFRVAFIKKQTGSKNSFSLILYLVAGTAIPIIYCYFQLHFKIIMTYNQRQSWSDLFLESIHWVDSNIILIKINLWKALNNMPDNRCCPTCEAVAAGYMPSQSGSYGEKASR